MGLSQPHGRQPGALFEHPSQDLPQRQLGGKAVAQGVVDAEAPGHFQGGPHGSDRGSLGQLDLVERAEDSQVAFEVESQFDGGDLFGVEVKKPGGPTGASTSNTR